MSPSRAALGPWDKHHEDGRWDGQLKTVGRVESALDERGLRPDEWVARVEKLLNGHLDDTMI